MKNKKLIIGIFILLIIIIGLICTYMVMNNKDEDKEIVSQKEKEPEVFAVLYNDGSLKFSSTEPDEDEDITQNFGNINELDENMIPAWRQNQYLEEIKKVEIIDEIQPKEVTYYWFAGMKNLKEIEGLDKINCNNITSISFANDAALEKVDLSMLDLSKVKSISFDKCTNLKEVNLEGTNLSNIDSFWNMFAYCQSLEKVNFNNVTTSSKLSNMGSMFLYCTSLKEADLSGLSDVSGVNGISNTFMHCESLEKVVLCKLSSPNFKNAASTFYGCKSLKDVDLSMIDTSNVGMMEAMFSDCLSLTTLDLSNFVLNDNANISCMFQNTPNLKTIYVGSGWNKSRESRGTFTNCGTSFTTVK